MFNLPSKYTTTLVFILLIALATSQIAPQFDVINKTLGAITNYKMSYYSNQTFNTSTTITITFSSSYIKIPDGSNNCTIRVNGVLASLPLCSCTNRICIFKPMTTFPIGSIDIEIHNITNPLFLYTQDIPVNIYFSNTANYSFPRVNIPGGTYQPMSMTINKITQSDYGVGYTPVTYEFNISLPYISKNMQMQLAIPQEVTFSSFVSSTLSFYNTVQNLPPVQVSSTLVYNLQIDQIINPVGFMFLTLSGLGNPTYLGNSSNFKITFYETFTIACPTCRIAEISSGITIESRNPGDILAQSITSNNSYISQVSSLSISLKFFAGIPVGGKVSIYLPPEIVPVQPIICAQLFGFIINGNSDPQCTYNSSVNKIDTVNFATPIFSSTGTGILSIVIINPQDSRGVNFKFETFDNNNRMIGQSRSNFFFNSIPIPLKVEITKTSQQVDKSFNMNCTIILTQSLNISSNYIELIFPPVNYNLTNIFCYSAGQDLNCSKTINQLQQLVIKLAPPCSQCNANNTLQFSIVKLKNPPFISDSNELITINTRSSLGIIESSNIIKPLSPTTINIFNYSKPISKSVGFQYNLLLNLSLPEYLKSTKGQIHIFFTPKSTYTDGKLSGFNYSGPSTTLEVTTSTGTTVLSNEVLYNDDTPSSINKIIFNVCDGIISVCNQSDQNFTFIIKKIKIGYIPSQQTNDKIRITTQFGEIIAETNIDTSLFAPIIYTAPLNIIASRSITNSFSDFQFTFQSNEVIFDKTLSFSLPISLVINGQCSINSTQGFISSFLCTKVSNNSISITSDFDQNLMISQNITYTIMIRNVTTPVSMRPLSYTLQTTYNSIKNQRFSSQYAIQAPCPLILTYSKTVYTINQQFKLSITITPVTLLYDSYQIILAKNTVITQKDWVSSYNLIENQTHYILSYSGLMTNNYTQIRAKNSLSTYQPPQYTVNLLQLGYLAQQNIISPPNNDPVMLSCNVTLTNRTVNFLTNMTITCDRNSNGQLNDKYLIMRLPANSFDYTGGTFNGVALNGADPQINITINTTSPRILSFTINSLKNLLYIPNPSQTNNYSSNIISSIRVTTIQDNSTMVVGRTTIQSINFIPNDAYDIKNSSAVRTSTKSGQFTNISLQYTTYLGTSQHVMQITLPIGQNGFNISSGCYFIPSQQACNIIASNSTDMRIALRPNTTVMITKSINFYPNQNSLKIRIFTFPQMQLVEEGTTLVSPAIALETITIIGRSTSSKVGDISTMSLQLKPTTLKIQSSNTIQILVPAKMFTRTFNTDDCVIKSSLSNNTYTGCSYDYDSNGWLTMIKVGSFGPFDVDINSSIFVNFSVTNAWTTYSFNNQSFVITIYKTQSTASSQGISNLADIYPNLTAFTFLPISQNQTKFSQQVLTSGTLNNLTIMLTVNGNIGRGTKIICMIPKDAFIYTPAAGIFFQREDSSYFFVSIATTCLAAGCQAYSQQFVVQVQNNYYTKKQRNNIVFYLQYDGLPNSQYFAITPDSHLPLTLPSLSLNRSSSIGGDRTTVSIKFNLTLINVNFPGVSWFGQTTIDLCKNITNSRYAGTTLSFNQQQPDNTFSQVQSVSLTQNNENITATLPSNVSNSSLVGEIKISGKNTIQTPIGTESYWIVVQNSTHILYITYNIMFDNKLAPMSQGLTILRSDTTVGMLTQLRIQGNLPADQIPNISFYPLTVNSVSYGNLNQTTIDILLNSYTNPQIISQQPLTNISICNISHCIYRQPNTIITPPLTPIQFTSNDIQVKIPPTMNIGTINYLLVNLTREIKNKSFIKIETDAQLYTSVQDCIVYFFNETSQRVDKMANINTTVTLTNTAGSGKKTITINSQIIGRTINISSIEIAIKSPDYQMSFQNTPVAVQFEPPSTIYRNTYNVTIIAHSLNANLSCTSNKTNQIANYTLNIEPLLKLGILTIQIPVYISSLFLGTDPTDKSDDTMANYLNIFVNGNTIPVNGTDTQSANTQIPQLYLLTYNKTTSKFYINLLLQQGSTPTSKTVKINIINVQNPPDNRIIRFKLFQHEIQLIPLLIYGYKELTNKMTVLDPIRVYSGIRNMTKIGARIELTFDIQTLLTTPDSMIIKLSETQVLANYTPANQCNICIDNMNCGNQNIIIQTVNGLNAIKISPHRPGRHNYTVSGCLVNSMFSQQPSPGDQIYVALSLPYQTAQTTKQTSTYITPLISTGQIQITNVTSTSNKRADYTTLSMIIKPQNWMNCDGISFKFDQMAYFVHRNIECTINDVSAPFYVFNSSSLFIQVTDKNSTLKIQIKNIINYIVHSGFVLSSLKKKVYNSSNTTQGLKAQMPSFNASDYGISDQITVPPINNALEAYSARTRLIFPDNYASSEPKSIVAINDYTIPAEIPVNTLKYVFQSNIAGCVQILSYNKTISISCKMENPGISLFNIFLYDTKAASMPLTSFSQSVYIYPRPKDHCSNVMCDVCSTGTDGSEYCFSCREGLYSSNGQCVEKCPDRTFPYNSRTCTQCSPQCASCFDLYDNSCLSCQDSTLLLDSGICRKYCSQGFAYQAQYCVDNQECSKASGCRLCSPSGFCYKCLPDFIGEPNCKFADILPKNFFVFWMIPFLLLIPIVGIITCVKVGTATFSRMLIFLLSVVELMSWIFLIPKMPEQAFAMIMCAFLLLKIIISIIAYQTYYNKQILLGKQQKLLDKNQKQSDQKTDHLQANSKKSKQGVKQESLQQKITHKERLARFSAHFLACDAYELLMNKLGKPYMNITHFTPFLAVSNINRIIVIIFCVFIIVKYASGDLLFVPLISILSGIGIILIRLINSQKFTSCISKIRG